VTRWGLSLDPSVRTLSRKNYSYSAETQNPSNFSPMKPPAIPAYFSLWLLPTGLTVSLEFFNYYDWSFI
jgi:hypothetical protein